MSNMAPMPVEWLFSCYPNLITACFPLTQHLGILVQWTLLQKVSRKWTQVCSETWESANHNQGTAGPTDAKGF